jgi:phosphoglycolate phosphatase-like HAD superfamily hydrolase
VEDKAAKVRRITAENGLDPAATLLVGDMKEDVQAGKAARVRTCAVITGFDAEPHLRALQPDLLCNDLGELRTMLERLWSD